MPSLAESIAAQVRQQGPRCNVALLRPNLSKAEIKDLDAAIVELTIPASAISRGLAALGHKVSQHTIVRHRRGECACAQ